jgi:hypothetical protein
MRKKPPKMTIQIVGYRFPRFIIAKGRRYWTGTGWDRDWRKALLYADTWLVQQDADELGRKSRL